MRSQDQQPKSFADLEQIISDMEYLTQEKAREYAVRSSSSGHSTDTTGDRGSKCDDVGNDVVWVKRISDGDDIWASVKMTNNARNKPQQKKRKSRRVQFSSLTECPLSHSKSNDDEKFKDSLFSSSPVTRSGSDARETKNQDSNRILLSRDVMPTYRKHQVAEFYGTNTFGAPLGQAASKENNDTVESNRFRTQSKQILRLENVLKTTNSSSDNNGRKTEELTNVI